MPLFKQKTIGMTLSRKSLLIGNGGLLQPTDKLQRLRKAMTALSPGPGAESGTPTPLPARWNHSFHPNAWLKAILGRLERSFPGLR